IGERPFVLELTQGGLSALEQALVHPSIVGQDSRLTLYISLSLFRKILVIGTHAFRLGPIICTLYLVAVVHPRQLIAISESSQDPAANDDYIGIPKVEFKISAGVTGFAVDQTDGLNGKVIYVARRWLEKRGLIPEKVFAAQVRGQNMADKLHEDDDVLDDDANSDSRSDAVFAFTSNGEFAVKRLKKRLYKWCLCSDTPNKNGNPSVECAWNTFIIGS